MIRRLPRGASAMKARHAALGAALLGAAWVALGADPPKATGLIELYSQPGFAGQYLRADEELVDLQRSRFNDRASSVVVRSGTWVLCTDANFGGRCRAYTPGAYPDLGYGMSGMSDRISSARIVRSSTEAPRGGGPQGRPSASSRVVLFSEPGLGGNSIAIAGPVVDLRSAGFNDAIASLVVESGRWELCSEASFRGRCRVLGPGQLKGVTELGFDRYIASLRPVG